MDSQSTKTFPTNGHALELMSEVFLHSTDWHARAYSYLQKGPVTNHPPLLFGRVCSRWRQISLSTPALLGNLVLSEEISTKAFDRNFAALGVFLERSGSYPLELKFPVDHQRRHFLGDNWKASLNRLIPMIIPHFHRWRVISGVFNQSGAKMIFSRFPNVPLLETLEIKVRGFYDKEVITIDLSEALPLSTLYLPDPLAHFRFGDSIQHNLRKLGGIKYGQLCLTLSDCFQCLAHCPSIEEFIAVIMDHLHTDLPTAMIELPNIERFEISCERVGDISLLFNALHLPAVEGFEFSSRSASTPLECPWSAIGRMLARSPKLRWLTIHTAPVVAEDLAKCLAHTPDLEYLDLQNIPHGNAIISLLTLPRPSDGNAYVQALCPKLTRFFLDFAGHIDQISATAVAEMILSRIPIATGGTYDDGSTVGETHSETSIHHSSQQTLYDVRLGSISKFTEELLRAQIPESVTIQVMIVNDTRTGIRLLRNRDHRLSFE
ncbi:hypothetical protein BD410DRAFT_782856 [Rickenella mellea]|uniref:F-box domain-containing protein n=1 Tax=Rickenella mellea TaxID=50990 RepID=A0A4Y7QH86_9AGAM|nr:hypothetical protein BD410DRAFT_782856 [Rickenella mellea]